MSGSPAAPPATGASLVKTGVDPTDTQDVTSQKHLWLRIRWEIAREPRDQRKYMLIWQLVQELCSAAYGQGLRTKEEGGTDKDEADLKEIGSIETDLENTESPMPYLPTAIPYEDGHFVTIKHKLISEASRFAAAMLPQMYPIVAEQLKEYAFHRKIPAMIKLKARIERIYSQRGWTKFDEVLATKATARERGTAFTPLPPESASQTYRVGPGAGGMPSREVGERADAGE